MHSTGALRGFHLMRKATSRPNALPCSAMVRIKAWEQKPESARTRMAPDTRRVAIGTMRSKSYSLSCAECCTSARRASSRQKPTVPKYEAMGQ